MDGRVNTGLMMFACVYSHNLKSYEALVDCAYAFSPLVEETADNTVVLDIEGCELLVGSPREIAKEIARHAAKLGLKVNVVVAQNPDAADLKKAVLYGLGKSQLGQRKYEDSVKTFVQLARLASAVPPSNPQP